MVTVKAFMGVIPNPLDYLSLLTDDEDNYTMVSGDDDMSSISGCNGYGSLMPSIESYATPQEILSPRNDFEEVMSSTPSLPVLSQTSYLSEQGSFDEDTSSGTSATVCIGMDCLTMVPKLKIKKRNPFRRLDSNGFESYR